MTLSLFHRFVCFYSNRLCRSRRNYCTKHIFVPPFRFSQCEDSPHSFVIKSPFCFTACINYSVFYFFLPEGVEDLPVLSRLSFFPPECLKEKKEKRLVVYILMQEKRRGGRRWKTGNKVKLSWVFLFVYREKL